MWVLEFKSLRLTVRCHWRKFLLSVLLWVWQKFQKQVSPSIVKGSGYCLQWPLEVLWKNMNGDQSRLQSHLLFGFEGRCHTDHWATTTKRQGGWHIRRHWRVSIASCDGSHWKYQCGSSARSESMISLYQLFIVFLDGREIKLGIQSFPIVASLQWECSSHHTEKRKVMGVEELSSSSSYRVWSVNQVCWFLSDSS